MSIVIVILNAVGLAPVHGIRQGLAEAGVLSCSLGMSHGFLQSKTEVEPDGKAARRVTSALRS